MEITKEQQQKAAKAAYAKKWREENKEKIALQKKAYQLNKKEETSKYNKSHYQKIKDDVKVKNDILEVDKRIKIKCECGAFIRKDGLLKHTRTNKHLKLIT